MELCSGKDPIDTDVHTATYTQRSHHTPENTASTLVLSGRGHLFQALAHLNTFTIFYQHLITCETSLDCTDEKKVLSSVKEF